jgi:metal-dependent amidase/aminoacylase/carboxypeptidase family protein
MILAGLDALLPDLEALYKDLHAHPELSMAETRTAGLAADRLRKAGFDVTTGVGKAYQAGRVNELPVNHSPRFAPVIHPTLKTGVETLVVATAAWTANAARS